MASEGKQLEELFPGLVRVRAKHRYEMMSLIRPNK